MEICEECGQEETLENWHLCGYCHVFQIGVASHYIKLKEAHIL
jgi:hypothetical protein